jgi:hypothetical protein
MRGERINLFDQLDFTGSPSFVEPCARRSLLSLLQDYAHMIGEPTTITHGTLLAHAKPDAS